MALYYLNSYAASLRLAEGYQLSVGGIPWAAIVATFGRWKIISEITKGHSHLVGGPGPLGPTPTPTPLAMALYLKSVNECINSSNDYK